VSASEYKLTGGGLLGCDVSGQRGSSASAASALGALTLLAMAARRRRVRA
jgi:MYXO-CTERM domain-containing protein